MSRFPNSLRKCDSLNLKRKLIRLVIGILFITALSYGALLWWTANEIASPRRAVVTEAHQNYFEKPSTTGFDVEKFVSASGMPWLICTPRQTLELSDRAKIIREQLDERGHPLMPSGETLGTLLILHGRKGIKENYLAVADRFCAVGLRCMIPDLPGHGANQEENATYGIHEAEMILDGYREITESLKIQPKPCAILGQSMGGSVAMHVATEAESPFEALIIVSSFDRLEGVIQYQTSNLLGRTLGQAVQTPASAIYWWKTKVNISDINPAEKAVSLQIPALVIHGDADRVVPTSAGRSLYKNIPDINRKQWITVPGAEHANIWITDFPLYASIAEWTLKHISPPPND
ncbi:MAG: alpha/beta hydrolase [Akkermansiaceae bacterium]